MENVLALCKKYGIAFGTTPSGGEAAGDWVRKGATFFEAESEIGFIRAGAAALACARALPRALRLRGLGGQITLDLAPMPKKDRRPCETALRQAFREMDTETFFSTLRFADDGLNQGGTVYPSQFQGGVPRLVYPPDLATAELIHPLPAHTGG